MSNLNTNQAIEAFFLEIKTMRLANPQKRVYVGLPGGTSLDIFYRDTLKAMEGLVKNKGILSKVFDNLGELKNAFAKTHFGFVDERVVNLLHPDSNYGSVEKKFFKQLKDWGLLRDDHISSIDPFNRMPARHYFRRFPRIDIGLFGVGPDGHIASLFPHHELLDDFTTKMFEIHDSPKEPAHRITVSREVIRKSKMCIVFFTGPTKLEALNNFQNKDVDEYTCPAKIVQECPKYHVVRTGV